MAELEDLLLSTKEPKTKPVAPNKDPYQRAPVVAIAEGGRDKTLKQLYLYTFTLSKAEYVDRMLL